jgi:hypothetical protein
VDGRGYFGTATAHAAPRSEAELDDDDEVRLGSWHSGWLVLEEEKVTPASDLSDDRPRGCCWSSRRALDRALGVARAAGESIDGRNGHLPVSIQVQRKRLQRGEECAPARSSSNIHGIDAKAYLYLVLFHLTLLLGTRTKHLRGAQSGGSCALEHRVLALAHLLDDALLLVLLHPALGCTLRVGHGFGTTL